MLYYHMEIHIKQVLFDLESMKKREEYQAFLYIVTN